MRVHIVECVRGSETVVAVEAVRSGRVLHACVGIGFHGHALALVEATAYCQRRGHTVVSADDGRPVAVRVA